ncbi:MAG: hypothetical protein ACR2LK_03905 [Solirubrobacteraceae bacterium]
MAWILAAALVGVIAGCGDDESGAPPPQLDEGARLSLAEVGSFLERGTPALVRTGGGEDYPGLVLRDSARYEDQSGREFDLLVFGSEDDAVQNRPSVVDTDAGESAIRAANVVAVFPAVKKVKINQAVARKMRRLRIACAPGGERGEPDLRELCFSDDGAVPPPGDGVDRSEAREREQPIVVGGLHYDPLTARRLNPRTAPDAELLSGRRPPAGKTWFAVFLRVCNRGDKRRTASKRLALVDAFGERVMPSTALPDTNPFAYEPRAIDPEDCLPADGSATERTTDGALVLFALKKEFENDRPVALEVTAADGSRERVILDL